MRLQPSCMIKFCIAKAAECRRRADAATDDPSRRQTWLAMEGEWFYLARSYDNERRGPSVGVCHLGARDSTFRGSPRPL
jgi:hypothetical protein